MTNDVMEMATITKDYFAHLFTSNGMSPDLNYVLFGIEKIIDDDMNRLLIKRYTTEEVFEALKGMRPTKALRIDGFPALFFQQFWHIMRGEVMDFCLKILNEDTDIS